MHDVGCTYPPMAEAYWLVVCVTCLTSRHGLQLPALVIGARWRLVERWAPKNDTEGEKDKQKKKKRKIS